MALLTNPFLNGPAPSTGGTTTPSTGIQIPNPQPVTAQSYGILGTPGSTTTNTNATIPLGNLAKAPTPTQPSNTLPSGQSSGTNGGSIDYTLHNGESIQAYNARIASARTTQDPQAPTAQAPAAPPQISGVQQTNPQGPSTSPYQATAPTYGGLVGSLATTASQPSPAFTQAQQQAQQALQDLQTSRTNEAQALSLNSQNPIPLEFQQGRGQILQNQYLAQQNAYANTYAGATAQEQAATGQQSAQQQGLGAAGALAAPQTANALGTFNPVTGGYSGYGAGTGGLQGAGGALGQVAIGQNVAQLNSYLGGAQVVGNNLNSLISSANINPSSLTYANGVLQFGANLMSNPQYQQFAGQINDFVSSLAPILGVGGNATDMKTQMSASIVNALQSGSTIQQVVSYFLDQAKQKLQGYQQGGGVNAGASGGQGGSGQGGSGQTFGNFFG